MGIAAGFDGTAACGITRVGAVEDVEFEFDVADIEMFTFGEVEMEVLEFDELKTAELAIIDRPEIRFDSAVRTSLTAFAAGVAVVAGAAGLISTRFRPTEVVLNCRY